VSRDLSCLSTGLSCACTGLCACRGLSSTGLSSACIYRSFMCMYLHLVVSLEVFVYLSRGLSQNTQTTTHLRTCAAAPGAEAVGGGGGGEGGEAAGGEGRCGQKERVQERRRKRQFVCECVRVCLHVCARVVYVCVCVYERGKVCVRKCVLRKCARVHTHVFGHDDEGVIKSS